MFEAKKELCEPKCQGYGYTVEKKACIERCAQNKGELFNKWLEMEVSQEGTWWADLPKCPKKICVMNNKKAKNPDSTVWQDPKSASFITDFFHPGAAFEMRTKGCLGPSGNQCIYNDKGEIETKIPSAGSADYRNPSYGFMGFFDHQDHDVEPYKLAKKLNQISAYFIVRPVWVE